MSALAEQHERWAEARGRLFDAPPPPAKQPRPRPVSPFVRDMQAHRRRQREAFERQMLPRQDEVQRPNFGWPPYQPVAPYDDCAGTPPSKGPITMREIIRQVAQKHGLSIYDLTSVRRPKHVVVARHEAMWRCKAETSNSLPQIGRAFGGRDHTTVLHGVKKHEQRMRETTNA